MTGEDALLFDVTPHHDMRAPARWHGQGRGGAWWYLLPAVRARRRRPARAAGRHGGDERDQGRRPRQLSGRPHRPGGLAGPAPQRRLADARAGGLRARARTRLARPGRGAAHAGAAAHRAGAARRDLAADGRGGLPPDLRRESQPGRGERPAARQRDLPGSRLDLAGSRPGVRLAVDGAGVPGLPCGPGQRVRGSAAHRARLRRREAAPPSHDRDPGVVPHGGAGDADRAHRGRPRVRPGPGGRAGRHPVGGGRGGALLVASQRRSRGRAGVGARGPAGRAGRRGGDARAVAAAPGLPETGQGRESRHAPAAGTSPVDRPGHVRGDSRDLGLPLRRSPAHLVPVSGGGRHVRVVDRRIRPGFVRRGLRRRLLRGRAGRHGPARAAGRRRRPAGGRARPPTP